MRAALLPSSSARIMRIATASTYVMSLLELCSKLRQLYPERSFASIIMPDPILYLASFWDSRISWGWFRDNLGVRHYVENTRSRQLLAITYRNDTDTLRDAMDSLAAFGLLERKFPRLVLFGLVLMVLLVATLWVLLA